MSMRMLFLIWIRQILLRLQQRRRSSLFFIEHDIKTPQSTQLWKIHFAMRRRTLRHQNRQEFIFFFFFFFSLLLLNRIDHSVDDVGFAGPDTLRPRGVEQRQLEELAVRRRVLALHQMVRRVDERLGQIRIHHAPAALVHAADEVLLPARRLRPRVGVGLLVALRDHERLLARRVELVVPVAELAPRLGEVDGAPAARLLQQKRGNRRRRRIRI